MRTKTEFTPTGLLADQKTPMSNPLKTTVILGLADGLDSEVEATLEFEVNRWGRARCNRLTMEAAGGGAISGTALRVLPLARIADQAVTAHGMFAYAGETAPGVHRFDIQLPRAAPSRAARKRHSDEYLRDEVATIYKAALEAPGNGHKAPVQAVMENCNLSRGGATKQIAEARRRGFLPATKRGKAAA